MIDWRDKVNTGIGAAIVTAFVLLVIFAIVGFGAVAVYVGSRV